MKPTNLLLSISLLCPALAGAQTREFSFDAPSPGLELSRQSTPVKAEPGAVPPAKGEPGYSSLQEQAAAYQAAFGNPANNFDYKLLQKSSSLFSNVSRPKVALKGVLYWGGSDGDRARSQSSLSDSKAKEFCKAGFSGLFYIYKKNTGPSTIDCGSNKLPYEVTGQVSPSNKMVRAVMESLFKIIRSNGKLGPAYLHCWWGIHASNTFASIALKQFCGLSNEQAVEHWNKIGHYPDPNNRALSAEKKEENRNKIRQFQPFADLQINEQERAAICFQ